MNALLNALTKLVGFFLLLWGAKRSGKTEQKLEQSEAINDQNDELLEYLKKEKAFIHRLSDPDFAERVRSDLNDNQK